MQKHKVLIVDDDKEFLEELQETLALSGYDSVAINDSTRAVDTAAKIKPDIILLDLKMDKMSGFVVATRLKQNADTSSIPIIAITGYFLREKLTVFMKVCELETCMEKPFSPLDVINQIERVIAKVKGRLR